MNAGQSRIVKHEWARHWERSEGCPNGQSCTANRSNMHDFPTPLSVTGSVAAKESFNVDATDETMRGERKTQMSFMHPVQTANG